MKKSMFILVCFALPFISPMHAQITLEQTYPTAGYYDLSTNANGYGNKLFYLVKLEVSGEKYVSVDLVGQNISFYNLNHSLYTTISYSVATVLTSQFSSAINQKRAAQLLYISEKLFDNDNQIEFMYCSSTSDQPNSGNAVTQIINEDGTILFSATGEYPFVRPTEHNQSYPIYNTANGTKMILSKTDGSAKVYSLGGTWSGILANNNINNGDNLMSLSPNPSARGSIVTLHYDLPADVTSADLKIYDTAGKEVESYRIGNEMHEIVVAPGDLPAGVYYYNIMNGSKNIGTKKSVVIE